MIRLTVFGQRDLVGPDGNPIQVVLQQPKQLAVLIYLALAGPGGVRSRDTALAMFWPDSTEPQARHSLSQVMHYLRQALGPEGLISRGRGEIGACAGVIWCDAVAFDQALKRGDDAEALDLYRGELLPGFFVSAASDFEHWVADERDRYRRSATAAAWRLAESAEKDGELRVAAGWAAKATEASLNDEVSVQQLLRLLDRIDDRVGALQAYEIFKRRLARECDIQPSMETKQLVAHIRSRATRVSSPDAEQRSETAVKSQQGVSDQLDASEPQVTIAKASPPATVETRWITRRRISRVIAPALLGVALVCLGLWTLHGHPLALNGLAARERTSVEIEPLTALDTSSASTSLGRVLADAIVDQLAPVHSFIVTAPARPGFKWKENEPRASIGPELRVGGTVTQSRGRVRVTVRIADAASGRAITSAVLDHAAGEQVALVGLLSRQISSFVRTTAGHEMTLHEWRIGSKRDNVYEIMQRVDEDRDLADQLERSGNFPAVARALRAADSALVRVELTTPGWAQPMIERAGVLERLGALYLIPPLRDTVLMRTLFGQGIAEAGRAVALNGHDAAALESLGTLSYWYWSTVTMPRDSAARLLARTEQTLNVAVAIDPNRAEAWSLLSGALYARADYAGAYLAANRAYRADAYLKNPQEILSSLSRTAYEIHDDSAAQYWCDELNRQFEGSWPGAYCRLNLLAWNGGSDAPGMVIARVWKIATDTAWSSAAEQRIEPHFQMLAAAVLARYGLRDSAEAVLRRAEVSGADDPELVPLEAHVRVLLSQHKAATTLLDRYVTGRLLQRTSVLRSRRFTALTDLQQALTRRQVPQAIR